MTETFNFTVHAGTSGQTTFRTRKAQFGDGYSQEVADGLNNAVQQWNITISNEDADDMDDVIAFLQARKGYESFYWTPPDGVQGLYRCNTFTQNPQEANIRGFSATFQQVFAP